MLRHLDLFSGIGGFSLACEWAGIETICFVENNKYCQKVLKKHWLDVPIVEDIRDVKEDTFKRPVDLVTGGFPCNDISVSGRRSGLQGKYSGLWKEMFRVISLFKPTWVLAENTPSLTVRGLSEICSDLSSIGYDTEWEIIPASYVCAPHLRARIWLLSYPRGIRDGLSQETVFAGRLPTKPDYRWATEPSICRVAHGIPNRVDRLKCLGNAIVPQVAYTIIQTIVRVDNESRSDRKDS